MTLRTDDSAEVGQRLPNLSPPDWSPPPADTAGVTCVKRRLRAQRGSDQLPEDTCPPADPPSQLQPATASEEEANSPQGWTFQMSTASDQVPS